jgi:hypothetical protein
LILARLKHEAKAVLAMLPTQELEQVFLSGLSVDDAVQQALKPSV